MKVVCKMIPNSSLNSAQCKQLAEILDRWCESIWITSTNAAPDAYAMRDLGEM